MHITLPKIKHNCMIKSIHYQRITNSLKLVKFNLGSNTPATKVVRQGVNYYLNIDVSGSMYYDLAKLRQQIKNKIAGIVKEGDTLTIIWFSGRGEAGILKEFIEVKDLKDLKGIHDAIDRFLKPVGMTGFYDPLVLVEKCLDRVPNKNLNSMIFMSDGYNNSASWSDIMGQLSKLNSRLDSAIFVEYGYYADSRALQQMAEEVGGEKIFAKDFDSYDVEFDKVFNQKTAPKINIDLSVIQPYLYYMYLFTYDKENTSITFYNASKKESQLLIPEGTEFLLGFSDVSIPNSEEVELSEEMYAASYVLADKLKYDKAEDFLYGTGDVSLIDIFSGSYGKEKLNAFKDLVKNALFDPTQRYLGGKDMSFKLNPNKFCLIDLFDLLQEASSFHPLHSSFKYERTGAEKKALTDDGPKMKIKGDETFAQPCTEIVVSSERANINLRVKYQVEVSLPANDFNLAKVDSYVYRNYTFVKDGIVHSKLMPISTNKRTFERLQAEGLIHKLQQWVPGQIYVLDLSSLPIINRSMAVKPSAKDSAKLQWDLNKSQLRFKYVRSLNDQYNEKTNIATATKWSAEIATWLESIGVTDYNGFNPVGAKPVPSGDVYMAPTLKIKLLKAGAIKSNADFLLKATLADTINDKIAKGEYKESVDGKLPKMNLTEQLMYEEYKSVNELLSGLDADELAKTVKEEFVRVNKERLRLLKELSQVVFGITLSRTWFKEFASFDETELDVSFDKTPLKVKFEYKEEEVAL
jgi:hypothetical protein